uniref:FYVE-type domain-containing protein n=1 Tax=Fagus sylvatica TaxID=28930 RepID=A0A2N9EHD6_FAGSY
MLSNVRNAMAISIPNSPYIESDNLNKGGSICANREYEKNVPHSNRHVMPCGSQQKEKNNILKDVMIWGEGVGGIVGGWVDRFGHHDGMQVDAVLPKLLESTMMFDVQNISLGGQACCLSYQTWGRIHVKSVACGEYQTCAVTDSGELYTWGDNGCGADLMGEERNRSQWLPCKLSGPLDGVNISHVSCGEWHTAIVSTSGQLFTYGDGTFGVLGHGNLQSVSQPKEVESLKVGKLFTWGDGDKGRLGHANQERKLLPTCVTQLLDHDFVQVSCGRMLTVGLTNLGTVHTMGSTVHGQLGNPLAKDKSITIVEGKLKEEFIKDISSGSYHIAVLTSSGSVYTWGKGANGQLGLGDIEDRNSPTLVETLRDRQVESIACGSSFTAAICLHKSVSFSDQSACSECKLPFKFTRKKHNCYNCGLLFCRACCSKKVTNASLAPDSSKAFGVCDPCFTNLQKITHSEKGIFKSDEMLIEEVQRLRTEPTDRTSVNLHGSQEGPRKSNVRLKARRFKNVNNKLRKLEVPQAREEAAKCKAAKEVIKAEEAGTSVRQQRQERKNRTWVEHDVGFVGLAWGGSRGSRPRRGSRGSRPGVGLGLAWVSACGVCVSACGVVFVGLGLGGDLTLGSTGTAKWAPYRYRVRIPPGYRACVPQAYPISAKKKIFRYGSGTGRVGSGTGRAKTPTFSVNLKLKYLLPHLSQPLDLTPLGLYSRFSLLYSLFLTSSTAGELGLCSLCLCSALRVSLLSVNGRGSALLCSTSSFRSSGRLYVGLYVSLYGYFG